MPRRAIYILSLVTLFGIVQQLSALSYSRSASTQLLAAPIENDASKPEAIASNMNFVNSIRLLVRQWRFGDRANDAVMPAYRLDQLGPSQSDSVIVDLLGNARDSGGPVVLLTKRPTSEDFVGRQLKISSSDEAGVQNSESLMEFLDLVKKKLSHADSGQNKEIYIATPEAVEGLEPDTDVVFFDYVPLSQAGQPE